MIWPIVSSLYVLAGGALVQARSRATIHAAGFDPVAALAVVTGTILLWPVLLALTIEQGGGW